MIVDLLSIRDKIIQPALLAIDSWDEPGERMVLATGAAESGYRTVSQSHGPALGYWQMEPRTHNDIFSNYLGATRRQHLLDGLRKLSDRVGVADELSKNHQYAAAMCRIFYLRVPKPLPNTQSLQDIAAYWKRYYNTDKGAGTIAQFVERASGVMSVN